jgi:DNA-binding NarL/FixJ family response regulator
MAEAADGIMATEEIMSLMPDMKIIMLTIHNDDELLIESYVAGAVDYLIKETDAETIYDTIRSAYSNKYFVGKVIAQKVKEKFSRGRAFETSALFFINNTVTILEVGARAKDLIFRKIKAYKLIFCKLI